MLFYSVKPSAFIRQRFGGRVADLLFSVCAGMTLINWYHVLLFAFQFEDCSGSRGAEDKIKAVDKPLSIVIKAKLLVKAIKIFISNGYIETDAVVQLA